MTPAEYRVGLLLCRSINHYLCANVWLGLFFPVHIYLFTAGKKRLASILIHIFPYFMRKILISALLWASALSAGAQCYISGEAGAWRNPSGNSTSISLAPTTGYIFGQHWSVAMSLGYKYNYKQGLSSNGITVEPSVRYTFKPIGPLSFFVDGGGGFGSVHYTGVDAVGSYSDRAWWLGLNPGVSVGLTQHLSVEAYLGFLGYRKTDDEETMGPGGFGFQLSGNDLGFGLTYVF